MRARAGLIITFGLLASKKECCATGDHYAGDQAEGGLEVYAFGGLVAERHCHGKHRSHENATGGHDRHEFQRRGTIRWEAFAAKPKQ